MIEKVNIKEGSKGDWLIEKFTVSKTDAEMHNIRAMFGGGGRSIVAGTYTRLKRGDTIVMSDTPAEMRDHMLFINRARGNVLINGLGIGMCVSAVLEKPDVEKVTVIEISQDLIDLVLPNFDDPRLTIINADAYEYQPPIGERYNAVWHDIWDTICEDNLPEMTKLHRKYGRRTYWQGSWCKELCERWR